MKISTDVVFFVKQHYTKFLFFNRVNVSLNVFFKDNFYLTTLPFFGWRGIINTTLQCLFYHYKEKEIT